MGGRHNIFKDWMLIELRNYKNKISKNRFFNRHALLYFSSDANGIIDNCVEVFNQMNKVNDISIDDQALYEADREVDQEIL